MTRETTKWPSTRWPITKIMSSDGCKGDTVPLEMGPWYDFHEVGCHLGNVGEDARTEVDALRRATGDFLGAMRKPRDRHAQVAADPVAILEEALSGYAPGQRHASSCVTLDPR